MTATDRRARIIALAARGSFLTPSFGYRECADLDGSYARKFLEEAGFTVVENRDAQGYGYALTQEGVCLSTNGYVCSRG